MNQWKYETVIQSVVKCGISSKFLYAKYMSVKNT